MSSFSDGVFAALEAHLVAQLAQWDQRSDELSGVVEIEVEVESEAEAALKQQTSTGSALPSGLIPTPFGAFSAATGFGTSYQQFQRMTQLATQSARFILDSGANKPTIAGQSAKKQQEIRDKAQAAAREFAIQQLQKLFSS